ncbi:MAG: hypothetical protein B7X02_01000, partial [Rhodospirillales bacterium 12-54-5]
CWGKNANGELGKTAGANDTRNALYVANRAPAVASALSGFTTITNMGSKGTTAHYTSGSVTKVVGWSTAWKTASPFYIDFDSGLNIKNPSSIGISIYKINHSLSSNSNDSANDFTGFGSGGSPRHGCIIFNDSSSKPKESFCRGGYSQGQLGLGSIDPYNPPDPNYFYKVQLPSGVALKKVSTGDYVSCGIGIDGQAYCWGDNQYGQLGNGTITQADVPQPVALPEAMHDLTSIVTSGATTCALNAP